MSWHYLQGPAAASWAGSCSAGAPSALAKLIPSRAACCSRGSATDCSPRFPYGMTFEPSTAARGAGTSTSLAGVSHAKTLAAPASASASPASARGCGMSLLASLARYDREACSWKTAQISFPGASASCSVIWPRWGLMRGGACWELATPVRRTAESESGSWPTPTVSMARRGWGITKAGHNYGPAAIANVAAYKRAHGYAAHPIMLEWLMGWPLGWTALEPLGTVKFRRWLRSHGRR